jgi:hypothetical protein
MASLGNCGQQAIRQNPDHPNRTATPTDGAQFVRPMRVNLLRKPD